MHEPQKPAPPICTGRESNYFVYTVQCATRQPHAQLGAHAHVHTRNTCSNAESRRCKSDDILITLSHPSNITHHFTSCIPGACRQLSN